MRARVGEPGLESELSDLSNEADSEDVVGEGTSADPETSFDHETPKDPDAPSSCVAEPKGVPVNVHFSSYWEKVTMPNAIRRYLYGEDAAAKRTPLTVEFDYRWQIVKDG